MRYLLTVLLLLSISFSSCVDLSDPFVRKDIKEEREEKDCYRRLFLYITLIMHSKKCNDPNNSSDNECLGLNLLRYNSMRMCGRAQF